MDTKADSNVIDASPTKEFFISMLVKDIPLIRSIIDLVDNSVDGARRLRKNHDYTGLSIRVEADHDHFKISDNCGGIPLNIAQAYAFRFGRPEGMPATEHSVGQFGVGMKRSLFKLGKIFRIESTTHDCRFNIEIDVDAWQRDQNPKWEFQFKSIEHGSFDLDECGTTITVESLHNSVANEFGLENFRTQLSLQLQSAHQNSMDGDLEITLNGIPLGFQPAKLFATNELRPAYDDQKFEMEGKTVSVKIFAGVSVSNPSSAGWNIFCNGRLVLEADQTNITGWGEGNGKTIPKYHNQFARFQGYVFFDSDDAKLLPWNTTKTGVDSDSEIFKTVRQNMIRMMRPVIDFLNWLDAENKEEGEGPLEIAVRKAEASPVKVIQLLMSSTTPQQFQSPERVPLTTKEKSVRIMYDRGENIVEKVKGSLGVRSNKDVGEKTFDYYVRMEQVE